MPTTRCVAIDLWIAPFVPGDSASLPSPRPTGRMTHVPDETTTEAQGQNAVVATAGQQSDVPQVEQPAKLIRIAMMVREMLEEVRRAPIDDRGRSQLRAIYGRVVDELKSGLSEPLADELERVLLPLTEDTPTESEIRIAQAQLLGWLEGIFQGIQAAIATQQIAAAAQLEEMRRRRLPSGTLPEATPGQYL